MDKKINSVHGKLTVPRLISDGMVLQRDIELKIWGWAVAGEDVTVDFIGATYSATTENDGRWEIKLPPYKAGGPFVMNIKAQSNSITIRDILIGDVWVCAGQSNIELPIQRVKDAFYEEVVGANNSMVRQYKIVMCYDFNEPKEELETGSWQSVNPESILEFSAVGYFFAQSLYEKYNIPMGLINASLGGSPAEAWMSEEALRDFPQYLEDASKYKDKQLIAKIIEDDEIKANRWFSDLNSRDQGLSQRDLPWYESAYDDTGWEKVNIPFRFENIGLTDFIGVVWLRKEMFIDSEMLKKPARLILGRIVDSDTAYINGIEVGNTGYQYPPRKYDIPENVLREGSNIISLRVVVNNGQGEIVEDKPYQLNIGSEMIDLKGEWKYKVGATINEPFPEASFIQWKPIGLYNSMISPLHNYHIKGVIWYQGESNILRAYEYQKLFSTLIRDWREKWKQGNFPFLYVQLPNYLEREEQPPKSYWAELREAQMDTLSVPDTGMAVAIDIGEWNDLHPLNKKDVGERLGLLAQKIAYGEDIVHSGPLCDGMKVEDGRVVLTFSSIGGGLVTRDGLNPGGFMIAGEDKRFIEGDAQIIGDKIAVWNKNIEKPVAVRYAWESNPSSANLYNKEGLPASPFRTDRE